MSVPFKLEINGSDVTATRFVSTPGELTINQGQEGNSCSVKLDYSDGATLPPVGATFVFTLASGTTIVLRANKVSKATERYHDMDPGGAVWTHTYDLVDPIQYHSTERLPQRKPFLNTNAGAIFTYLFAQLAPELSASFAAGDDVSVFDLRDFGNLGDILTSEIGTGSGYIVRMGPGATVQGNYSDSFTANSDWAIDQNDYRYTPSRFEIGPGEPIIDSVTVSPTNEIPVSRSGKFAEIDPRVQSSIPLENNVFGLNDAEILKITAGQDVSDTKLWEVSGSIGMTGSHILLGGTLVMLEGRPFVSPFKTAWTGIIPDNGTSYQFGFQDDSGGWIWSVASGDYPLTASSVDDQYLYGIYCNPTGPSSFEVWGHELHQVFGVNIDTVLGHVASVDYCTNTLVLDTAWTVDNKYIRILSEGALVECLSAGDEVGRAKIISRSGATLVVDVLPRGIAAGQPVTRGLDVDEKETTTLIKTVSVGAAKYGLPAISGSGVHLKAMIIQKTGMIDGYLTSESSPGLDQTYPKILKIDVDVDDFSDAVISGSGASAAITLAEKFSQENCASIVVNYINGGKHDFESTCGSAGGHITISVDEQDPVKLQAIADRICEIGSRNIPRVTADMHSTEIVGNPLPWDPLPLDVPAEYRVSVASVPIISSQFSYHGSRIGADDAYEQDVLIYNFDAGDKTAEERAREESLRGRAVGKYPLRTPSVGGARITNVTWDGTTLTASISGAGTVYGPFGQVLDLGGGIDPAREAGVSDKESNPVVLHCTTDGGNYQRDSLSFTVNYAPSYVSPDSINCRYFPKRNMISFNGPRSRGAASVEVQRIITSTGLPEGFCAGDLVSSTGCVSGLAEQAATSGLIAYWQTVDYIDGRSRIVYELPYEPLSKGIRFRGIGLCNKMSDWTEACCSLPRLPKPDPFSIVKVFEGGTIVLYVGPPPTGCDEGRAKKLRLRVRAIGASAEVDLYDASGNPDEDLIEAFMSTTGCTDTSGCYDKLKIQDFPITSETEAQEYRIIYQEYDPGENLVISGQWIDGFNDPGHNALATTFAMGPPGCPRRVKIRWTHATGYKTKWKIPESSGDPFEGQNADAIFQYEVIYWIIDGSPQTSGLPGESELNNICPGSTSGVTNYMGADDGQDYGTTGYADAVVFVEKQYHHAMHLDKSEIDPKFWKKNNSVHVCVRAWNIVNGKRAYGPWACTERGYNDEADEASVGLTYLYGGEDAAFGGGYLFAGNLIQNRVEIIDTTNWPPSEVGQFDLKCGQLIGGGFAYNRVASSPDGNIAYTTGELQGSCATDPPSSGVVALNVTDKANPELIGVVISNDADVLNPFTITDLYSAGSYLWAYAGSTGELRKYSLGNPLHPEELSRSNVGSNADGKIIMQQTPAGFIVRNNGTLILEGGSYSVGDGGWFAYTQFTTEQGGPLRKFLYLPLSSGNTVSLWDITDQGAAFEVTLRQSFDFDDGAAPHTAAIKGDVLWVAGTNDLYSFDVAVYNDPLFIRKRDLPTAANHDYGVYDGQSILAIHGSSAGVPTFGLYRLGAGDEGGTTTIDGDLIVDGGGTIGGDLIVGGGLTVGGDLDVGGDITVGGTVIAGGGFGTTGWRVIPATSGETSEMRFYDLALDNYVCLQAPDVLTQDTCFSLMPEDGTSGQVVTTDGSGHLSFTDAGAALSELPFTLNVIIDGGGSPITTGVKLDVMIDFNCVIESATLLADQAGDIVIDIWNDVYGVFPPTVADSITASAKPTLSGAAKSQDLTLTGWSVDIFAGDILRFNVDSVATITRATLALKLARV